MDNFYTTTVYEKGAEVIRMYETLIGRDNFRKGMDLYFQRHDGEVKWVFFLAMAYPLYLILRFVCQTYVISVHISVCVCV
jgi:hypothetical protein